VLRLRVRIHSRKGISWVMKGKHVKRKGCECDDHGLNWQRADATVGSVVWGMEWSAGLASAVNV